MFVKVFREKFGVFCSLSIHLGIVCLLFWMSYDFPAERQDWKRFGNPKPDTGLNEETIDTIWSTYAGEGTDIETPLMLYQMLSFIHMNPRRTQSRRILGCSHGTVQNRLIPGLSYLAAVVDEIDFSSRLSFMNHGYHFPVLVTGMVDTFPIYVVNPRSRYLFNLLNNPKYNGPVYKYQMACDFLGRIILFTGPHLGTVSDNIIWRSTMEQHRLLEWEWMLADGIYISEPQLLTPFKNARGEHLSKPQYFCNAVLAHYRARIEHTNARIQAHAMFQYPFRGSRQLLSDCITVAAHSLNIDLKRSIRYPPVGPWSHLP